MSAWRLLKAVGYMTAGITRRVRGAWWYEWDKAKAKADSFQHGFDRVQRGRV